MNTSEFDTSKADIAYEAFIKILGRLRAGVTRQLIVISTPEGFRAFHRIFVKEKTKHAAKLIRAKTTDNFYLPQDFIDTLLASYTEKQKLAYISGEFVNMSTGTVMEDFNSTTNHATIDIDNTDTDIHIATDFNIGGCVTLSAIFQNDQLFVFGERVTKNTFETRDFLITEYPTQDLWCAADSSGSNKNTSASESDHDILMDHPGLVLIQGRKNPDIQDSVLSCNAGFRNKQIFIDTDKCPKLTEALIQHAYDKFGKPEKFPEHPSVDDYTDAFRYLVWALLPITKTSWSNYHQK